MHMFECEEMIFNCVKSFKIPLPTLWISFFSKLSEIKFRLNRNKSSSRNLSLLQQAHKCRSFGNSFKSSFEMYSSPMFEICSTMRFSKTSPIFLGIEGIVWPSTNPNIFTSNALRSPLLSTEAISNVSSSSQAWETVPQQVYNASLSS